MSPVAAIGINHLALVRRFHERFGLPIGDRPRQLERNDFEFRVEFMKEELRELIDAYEANDLTSQADALVDLEYVLHGLVLWMGFGPCWDALHAEVHRTNMLKVRVENAADSKRGHAIDVKKPPGWTPPDLHSILVKYGA